MGGWRTPLQPRCRCPAHADPARTPRAPPFVRPNVLPGWSTRCCLTSRAADARGGRAACAEAPSSAPPLSGRLSPHSPSSFPCLHVFWTRRHFVSSGTAGPGAPPLPLGQPRRRGDAAPPAARSGDACPCQLPRSASSAPSRRPPSPHAETGRSRPGQRGRHPQPEVAREAARRHCPARPGAQVWSTRPGAQGVAAGGL